jgi:hypothetical protein
MALLLLRAVAVGRGSLVREARALLMRLAPLGLMAARRARLLTPTLAGLEDSQPEQLAAARALV